MPSLAGIVVGLAAVVGLRLFAGRRLHAGQGFWVWVAFAPTLVIFGFLLVTMAQLLPTAPLLAIPGVLLSDLLLGLLLRAFWRVQRSVRPGQSEGNAGAVMDAMSEPMVG